MAKLTKAQARRRLLESFEKCQKVFLSHPQAMTVKDIDAIDKIILRVFNRLNK